MPTNRSSTLSCNWDAIEWNFLHIRTFEYSMALPDVHKWYRIQSSSIHRPYRVANTRPSRPNLALRTIQAEHPNWMSCPAQIAANTWCVSSMDRWRRDQVNWHPIESIANSIAKEPLIRHSTDPTEIQERPIGLFVHWPMDGFSFVRLWHRYLCPTCR